MKLIKGFRVGIKAFSDALGFIFRNRLTHYFIYPLILSILYWVGGLQLIGELVQYVSDAVNGRFDIEPSTIEDGKLSFLWELWETLKGWYNNGYTAIIGLLIRLAMWLLLLMVSKYILLAVLSPVLALLSERTEEIVTGNKYPFSMRQLLKDSLRGVLVAIRNLFAELGLLLVLWIITLFLPFLAPFSAVLSLLLGAFYYGFSMIDYINERRKMGLKEGFQFIRSKRGMTVALGLGIALGMTIPVIGFIIASFTSIIGAVAAVLATSEKNKSMNELDYQSSIQKIDI